LQKVGIELGSAPYSLGVGAALVLARTPAWRSRGPAANGPTARRVRRTAARFCER
jgi:hypothetical protein